MSDFFSHALQTMDVSKSLNSFRGRLTTPQQGELQKLTSNDLKALNTISSKLGSKQMAAIAMVNAIRFTRTAAPVQQQMQRGR